MTIPVFLNGRSLEAEEGGTLGSLVALHEPELLQLLLTGNAIATDGRAIPVKSDAPLVPGGIFYVKRSARNIDPDSHA